MNKYHNKITEYNGVKYHSKKEAQFAKELDLKENGGLIVSWDRQSMIQITVNKKPVCKMYLDFRVVHWKNNSEKKTNIEYIELKGGRATQTPVFKLKWKLLQATRPDLWLTLKD